MNGKEPDVGSDGGYALTLRQPWASLVIHGQKDVANRSWAVPRTLPCSLCDEPINKTRHPLCSPFPFRLWIHAGKQWDESANDHPMLRVVTARVQGVLFDAYETRGALLGSVLVTGCHHADECDCHLAAGVVRGHNDLCSPWAEPNAYHWQFRDPQPLPEPIPMRGRQKLWRLPLKSLRDLSREWGLPDPEQAVTR